MNVYLFPEDFVVKEFYFYPTYVGYSLAEWDEGFHENFPGMNDEVKEFFEVLLKRVEGKLNKTLRDNKIAMKILHIPTNTVLYVGYADWNWRVGLAVNTSVKPLVL